MCSTSTPLTAPCTCAMFTEPMSCFNYINSFNYPISFCKVYRICLVSTTLTPSTTQFPLQCLFQLDLHWLFQLLNFILWSLKNMSCFNYINSVNYVKLFQLHRTILLTEYLQNVSYFNYLDSFNYSISFCKVYRICLVSTTLTPPATWKSTMLTTSTA